MVGIIHEDPSNVHGDSPSYGHRDTRLETGFINAEWPHDGLVDDARNYGIVGFDNYSSPFIPGSTSFGDMIRVLGGGAAKGWAGPSPYITHESLPIFLAVLNSYGYIELAQGERSEEGFDELYSRGSDPDRYDDFNGWARYATEAGGDVTSATEANGSFLHHMFDDG